MGHGGGLHRCGNVIPWMYQLQTPQPPYQPFRGYAVSTSNGVEFYLLTDKPSNPQVKVC